MTYMGSLHSTFFSYCVDQSLVHTGTHSGKDTCPGEWFDCGLLNERSEGTCLHSWYIADIVSACYWKAKPYLVYHDSDVDL